MSRAAKGALAFGAAVVLWRTADLFLFTDVPTGFCAGGAVWRYAAMGLCALAAWLFPLAVPRQSAAPGALPGTHAPWCAAFGAACTAFGLWAPVSLALYGPQLSGHHVTPQREMLAALGLALRGVWFFALGAVCLLAAWSVYAQREGRALALGPGVAASGALYLHAVLRFIDAPASLHHVQPTAEVLCALCAVLFFAALLRAAAPEGAAARGMCRAGLAAFYFCACWGLPQLVWQLCTGAAGGTPVLVGFALALLGLWGAAVACGAMEGRDAVQTAP